MSTCLRHVLEVAGLFYACKWNGITLPKDLQFSTQSATSTGDACHLCGSQRSPPEIA